MDMDQLKQKFNTAYWDEIEIGNFTILYRCPLCKCLTTIFGMKDHMQYHIANMEALEYIHKLLSELKK
jgi:hypothetical protein